MKTKLGIVSLLVLVSISCSRKNFSNISELEIIDLGNYYNFYVVDTIQIKDPVRIHSKKYGGQFILSKAILKEYDGKRRFFLRPDVFMVSTDLYWVLQSDQHSMYNYPDYGGCKLVESSEKQHELEVYEYASDSVNFILGLINGDYYNKRYNSYDYFALLHNDNKSLYYRIVYPLCK
jgi:hypothetical protein